jgi:CHAD domain-containing protein
MVSSPDPRQFACARATSLLNGLLNVLDLQLQRTLKTPDAAEVHDLRVATRRFTQALVIFDSCFPGARGIREKLKLPMTLSGEVRDFDIALEILGSGRTGVSAKTVKRVERERAKFKRALVKTLGKIAKRGTMKAWRAKLEFPHRVTAGAVASKARSHAGSRAKDVEQAVLDAAGCFFDRGDKAYAASGSGSHDSSPKNPSKALHHSRIATKELRYTLELAIPPGAKSRNGLDRIEQLQSDLGDIHDFDPVHQILSEYRSARKLLARLAKKQHKRIRKFREYWKNEFGGKKNRAGWMRRIAGVADALVSIAVPGP